MRFDGKPVSLDDTIGINVGDLPVGATETHLLSFRNEGTYDPSVPGFPLDCLRFEFRSWWPREGFAPNLGCTVPSQGDTDCRQANLPSELQPQGAAGVTEFVVAIHAGRASDQSSGEIDLFGIRHCGAWAGSGDLRLYTWVGQPQLRAIPDAVVFGSVPEGEEAEVTLQLANFGDASLVVLGLEPTDLPPDRLRMVLLADDPTEMQQGDLDPAWTVAAGGVLRLRLIYRAIDAQPFSGHLALRTSTLAADGREPAVLQLPLTANQP